MDSQVVERRTHNRFGSSSLWHLNAVLRPGRVVRLVNLSSGGALIEGRRPLRPGSRVYLQLSTDRRSAGRNAQILRCAVASLSGSDGVQYHGALKFDQEWEMLWEELTRCGYAMPGGDGSAGGGCGQVIPTRGDGTLVVDEGGR